MRRVVCSRWILLQFDLFVSIYLQFLFIFVFKLFDVLSWCFLVYSHAQIESCNNRRQILIKCIQMLYWKLLHMTFQGFEEASFWEAFRIGGLFRFLELVWLTQLDKLVKTLSFHEGNMVQVVVLPNLTSKYLILIISLLVNPFPIKGISVKLFHHLTTIFHFHSFEIPHKNQNNFSFQ